MRATFYRLNFENPASRYARTRSSTSVCTFAIDLAMKRAQPNTSFIIIDNIIFGRK